MLMLLAGFLENNLFNKLSYKFKVDLGSPDSTYKFIAKIADIISKAVKPSASPSAPSIPNSSSLGGARVAGLGKQ